MKRAFTLAEVLITLGVIGVVASMTLPSVISKYKSKALEVLFKKSYSNAQQALILTKADLGVDNLHQSFTVYDPDLDEYINSKMFIDSYYKKMKVIGEVDYKKPPRNYTLNKNFKREGITCIPTKMLPDGTSMCVNIWSATISVTVDTNGPEKAPNAFGHDIFMFRVDPQKDMLVGQKPEDRAPNPDSKWPETDARPCSTKYSTAGNGLGCSYYAIINESPDQKNQKYWENLPK